MKILSLVAFFQIVLIAQCSFANSSNPKSSIKLASGQSHNCAIVNKRVFCWGHGVEGYDTYPIPGDIKNPIEIAAGAMHTCVIDSDHVKCWGLNRDGQISVPAGIKKPTKISAGLNHTCIIDNEQVKCWGRNDFNQLSVPSGIEKPINLTSSGDHTCVTDVHGVKCWGNNRFGQTDAPVAKVPIHVSAGHDNTCGIFSEQSPCKSSSSGICNSNSIQCWGGTDANGESDSNALKFSNPTVVASGDGFSCANTDKIEPFYTTVLCWGKFSIPTYLYTEPVTSIVAGWRHICILFESNKVKCWSNSRSDYSGVTKVPIELQ